MRLAAVGPGDRLDALRPAPSRFERGAHHRAGVEVHDLDRSLLDRSRFVGLVEPLVLQRGHVAFLGAVGVVRPYARCPYRRKWPR
jgi:hypothetical protein